MSENFTTLRGSFPTGRRPGDHRTRHKKWPGSFKLPGPREVLFFGLVLVASACYGTQTKQPKAEQQGCAWFWNDRGGLQTRKVR